MQSHHYIALFLITTLFIFAVWDVYLALHPERKTLSRWVINESKKRRSFAWFALSFALLIFVLGAWLIFHWFLPCILFNVFCWVDI